MATLNTTNIKHASSGSNNIVLASDGKVTFPQNTGNILQVVHVNSNTHMTSTATSYTDLTGITATITPASSSNKILIVCNLAISKQNDHSFLGRVVRDGSAISGSGGVAESGHGNQEDGAWVCIRTTNNDLHPTVIHYLDSPATTSATTYKAQGKTSNSGYGFALNKTNASTDALFCTPAFSSITLWEVSA